MMFTAVVQKPTLPFHRPLLHVADVEAEYADQQKDSRAGPVGPRAADAAYVEIV